MGEDAELPNLRQALDDARLPEGVRQQAERELRRLAGMPSLSPEGAVVRGYLDWLLALPWTARASGAVRMPEARRLLEAEHFG